jgi:hypothetical protein
MSTIGTATAQNAALRTRLIDTLKGMNVQAQELLPTCTTGDMIDVTTSSADQHAVFDGLLKSSVGGKLLFCDGPPASAQASKADVLKALSSFPGVVSATEAAGQAGQKPSITITTQNADQRQFMQQILNQSMKVDGTVATICVKSQH